MPQRSCCKWRDTIVPSWWYRYKKFRIGDDFRGVSGFFVTICFLAMRTDPLHGVKEGILLEVGFDDTAPNQPCDISSWALDAAHKSPVAFIDRPEYQKPVNRCVFRRLTTSISPVTRRFSSQIRRCGNFTPRACTTPVKCPSMKFCSPLRYISPDFDGGLRKKNGVHRTTFSSLVPRETVVFM